MGQGLSKRILRRSRGGDPQWYDNLRSEAVMTGIWLVVVASVGSAFLLTSLCALLARLVERRNRKAIPSSSTLESETMAMDNVQSGFGVEELRLEITAVSLNVLSNEAIRQPSAQRQKNVLDAEPHSPPVAELNASVLVEA
jgi:hypothetical protein